MGDRCAGRAGQRAIRAVVVARLGAGRADPDDARLWRHAHRDGGVHADARRRVRPGLDERGAAARLSRVRAHAPALAALPSRAQDGWAHPHPRARPQRDRDHRAHGDHAGGAYRNRTRLVVAVLLYQFDWLYVVVILLTVVCYTVYTYLATEWRIGIRRRMNDSDTDANVKAIDSLLNYETVKYFVAEEREARRYDRAMERYERASVEAYVSLAVLNAGQATIFTIGLAACMVMCAYGIKDGRN